MEDFFNRKVRSLSGGQRQKLNILLSILHKPKLVILDELSTGLEAKHYLPVGAVLSVEDGVEVAAGDILARIPRESTKTRDITGGLPRVADLVEARRPKDHAVIAEVDGRIEFGKDYKSKRRVLLHPTDGSEPIEYMLPKGKHVVINEGDFVKRGDMIIDGNPVLQDILKVMGVEALASYMVSEIQAVYRLQGVKIDDKHIEGHTKLAKAIQSYGSLAVIQLHHAGMRSPKEVINQQPVCPSNNEEFDTKALSLDEVKTLRDDFISASIRSQKAGYNGIEVHGAHGYILCQFLSTEINKREDEYGGSLENRSRILFEIIDGIREKCGTDFLIGIRLSPERFGMELQEIKTLSQQLIDKGNIDFLDISLWDCFKYPEDDNYKNKTLLEHITALDYKNVKLTVAGKLSSGKLFP